MDFEYTQRLRKMKRRKSENLLLAGSSASAEPALTAEQKKTRALRSRLSGK